jgi:hypothetical protein
MCRVQCVGVRALVAGLLDWMSTVMRRSWFGSVEEGLLGVGLNRYE